MGWIVVLIAVGVFIIIIVIIIALILFADKVPPQEEDIPREKGRLRSQCVSQADCGDEFVCQHTSTLGYPICLAGLLSPCTSSADCAAGTTCVNSICHRSATPQVPAPQPTISNVTVTPQPIVTPNVTVPNTTNPNVTIPPQSIIPTNTFTNASLNVSGPPNVPQQLGRSSGERNRKKQVPLDWAAENSYDGTPIIIGEDPTPTLHPVAHQGPSKIGQPLAPSKPNIIEGSDGGTPCSKVGNIFYCRERKGKRSGILDVCSFSHSIIYVYDSGSIVRETSGHRDKVTTNVPITRLESFDGYLYGVSGGCLYELSNNTFETGAWEWAKCPWATTGIIHTSGSHDHNTLWLQTNTHGYLHRNSVTRGVKRNVRQQHEKYSITNKKRVYGRDSNHYIEIGTDGSAIIYPSMQTATDIHDGALNLSDELVAISTADKSKYKGVRLVNWNPYFIRA